MIFDVITSIPVESGDLQFTAAESPPLQVAVGSPSVPVILMAAGGELFFNPGDNILLMAISPYIAYGFGQAVGSHFLGLNWIAQDDSTIVIPELSGGGIVTIPNLCDGLEFPGDGLFLRAPRDRGNLRLAVTSVDLNVSMLGLPSALAGQVMEIQYHLKIGHTLPMFGGT
jgi:hypothetical protein